MTMCTAEQVALLARELGVEAEVDAEHCASGWRSSSSTACATQ